MADKVKVDDKGRVSITASPTLRLDPQQPEFQFPTRGEGQPELPEQAKDKYEKPVFRPGPPPKINTEDIPMDIPDRRMRPEDAPPPLVDEANVPAFPFEPPLPPEAMEVHDDLPDQAGDRAKEAIANGPRKA